MRANFEIWGEDSEMDGSFSPSPEPESDMIMVKSLVSAANGLFVHNGPMGMRVKPQPGEDPQSADDLEGVLAKKAMHGHSDNVPKDVLHTISRTINKTHASLKRSRLIHVFYILSLPLYTILGALIFMYLDGDYDEIAIKEYESRCNYTEKALTNLQENCGSKSVNSCLRQIEEALKSIDDCFRSKNYVQFPTLTMKSFVNSLLYATSVYTTIGYGNIAAETVSCRVATVIYAIIGIPLFFAFLKDMGQLFSVFFIKGWRAAGRLKRRIGRKFGKFRSRRGSITGPAPSDQQGFAFLQVPKRPTLRRTGSQDSGPIHGPIARVREQRRVFLWAVGFFIIYLFAVSGLFCIFEEKWDFFLSFYFLFTSVALIGFGDVFPKNPNVVLINFAFIVLGIILFGMCYFILQEEIRQKAFAASRRVRNSIFKHQQRYKKRFSLGQLLNGKPSSPETPISPGWKRRLKDRRRSAPTVVIKSVGQHTTV